MIWLRKYRTKFAICWTQTSYPMWTHTRERINNVQVADLLIMLELEGKLLKLHLYLELEPQKRGGWALTLRQPDSKDFQHDWLWFLWLLPLSSIFEKLAGLKREYQRFTIRRKKMIRKHEGHLSSFLVLSKLQYVSIDFGTSTEPRRWCCHLPLKDKDKVAYEGSKHEHRSQEDITEISNTVSANPVASTQHGRYTCLQCNMESQNFVIEA